MAKAFQYERRQIIDGGHGWGAYPDPDSDLSPSDIEELDRLAAAELQPPEKLPWLGALQMLSGKWLLAWKSAAQSGFRGLVMKPAEWRAAHSDFETLIQRHDAEFARLHFSAPPPVQWLGVVSNPKSPFKVGETCHAHFSLALDFLRKARPGPEKGFATSWNHGARIPRDVAFCPFEVSPEGPANLDLLLESLKAASVAARPGSSPAAPRQAQDGGFNRKLPPTSEESTRGTEKEGGVVTTYDFGSGHSKQAPASPPQDGQPPHQDDGEDSPPPPKFDFQKALAELNERLKKLEDRPYNVPIPQPEPPSPEPPQFPAPKIPPGAVTLIAISVAVAGLSIGFAVLASNHKAAAIAAADEAGKSATNANAFAQAADKSAANAESFAQAADKSATNADAFAQAADKSATNADAFAQAAGKSATNANAFAQAADKSAANAARQSINRTTVPPNSNSLPERKVPPHDSSASPAGAVTEEKENPPGK